MKQLEPYLFFNGNCAEAMRFYEKTLGGKVEMMMKASEAPGGVEKPGSKADGILHAAISVDGQRLLASDWMSPDPYPGISGVSLSLVYQTVDEAARRFNALADGGKVTMPMAKTFFSPRFGMLADKFGVQWMILVAQS